MALNVSVIVSAIDRLSGPVKGMSASMQGLRNAGTWMSAAGAAVGGTLLAAAKSAEGLGSTLNDMSARVNVSGTALSELKYAAEQTGASLSTVETGLKFVGRNASAAASGTGPAAAAFAKLGVSVTDSSGKLKDADVLMTEAGDGLRNLKDENERTALAMAIFGRSGTQLLPMLLDAKGGVRGLREEARRLGLSLSEEDIKAADDFGDSMARMSDTAGMAFKRLGFIAIPAITAITERIVTVTAWFSRFSQEHPVMARGFVMVAAGVGILLSVLGPILFLLPALVNGWTILRGALTLTKIAAYGVKAEMLVAGAAARVSGLYAAVSSLGWQGLGKAAAAAGMKMLAAAWPILVAVAAVLTLVGAIKRMIQLFDDVKNHKWADAVKHAAEGLIPGDFIFRGGEQVLEWANSAMKKFGVGAGGTDADGNGAKDAAAGAPTIEDLKAELGKIDTEAATMQTQAAEKMDSAATAHEEAAVKTTEAAGQLVSAAEAVRGAGASASQPAASRSAATQEASQQAAATFSWQKRTDALGNTVWTKLQNIAGVLRGVGEITIPAALTGYEETTRAQRDEKRAAWGKPLANVSSISNFVSYAPPAMAGSVGRGGVEQRPVEYHSHITVQLDGKTVAQNEHVQKAIASGSSQSSRQASNAMRYESAGAY